MHSRKEYYDNHRNIELQRSKDRAKANRQWMRELKEATGCLICSTKEDLEYHHRDPSQKHKRLSKMVNHSKQRILEEIAKCDVLCKQCHNDKHRYVEGIKVILIPIPIYIPIQIGNMEKVGVAWPHT